MVRNESNTDQQQQKQQQSDINCINNNREEKEATLDHTKVVEGRNGLMVIDPENNPTSSKRPCQSSYSTMPM